MRDGEVELRSMPRYDIHIEPSLQWAGGVSLPRIARRRMVAEVMVVAVW